MDEGTTLESIFNDEPTDTVEAAPVEAAPEQPEAPEQPSDGPARGPDGKFIPKQQSDVEDTGPSPGKLPQEEYKAIREEREKRQRLEAELADLRSQFQSFQQPQEPPAPPPSLWEDENAWGGQLVQQAVQQAEQKTVMRMSEMMARQANPDFDDLKAEFLSLAEKNPTLADQALADPHPWNKAIQIAKNHKAMADLGATDLDSLKAKIREELMAEMQATPPASTPYVPPSITGERNVGSRSGPAWAGPRSLDDLLR